MQINLEKIYDELSVDYEEKYIQGENNPYMRDEVNALNMWLVANFPKGRIASLGVGSGQDIKITDNPNIQNFIGFDVSNKMMENGRKKYPGYQFVKHDCNEPIPESFGQFDILVSMFGTANYIGVESLLMQYKHCGCRSAFFVFYAPIYDDGIVDECFMYSLLELEELFQEYNPKVCYLPENKNYIVVYWHEDS